MLYKKEITDQVMIQYIILFTMAKADRIVTHNQLTSLVLDNCNIKFTDFRIALDNLEKTGHIRIFQPPGKETYCELLSRGREANTFFEHQIPVYIREPIKNYISPFFKEDAIKRSVTAELLPLSETEYMADFAIYDGSTPLMKLSVYAGTRKYASSMIEEFKKDPQKVYETIINMIGNNDNDETENKTDFKTQEETK